MLVTNICRKYCQLFDTITGLKSIADRDTDTEIHKYCRYWYYRL